jgi:hypothetical protein
MRKDSAIAAGCLGAGMNLVSLFAPVLGLSASTQRIGFAFGVMLMLLGVALYFRQRQEPAKTMGDTNINYGQQGIGINKGTVNIGAPQSEASGQIVSENEKTDEGFVTTAAIHLKHPYAAPGLAVLVNRTSVKEMRVGPTNGGMWATTEIRSEAGRQGIFVDPPLVSDYQAEVVTDEPQTDLAFEVRLDVTPPPGN